MRVACLLLALGVGIALPALGQQSPPEPISLRYQWRVGQRFRYELRFSETTSARLTDAAGKLDPKDKDTGLPREQSIEAVYRLRYEVASLGRRGGANLNVTLEAGDATRQTRLGKLETHLAPPNISYRLNDKPNRRAGAPHHFPTEPLRLSVTARGGIRITRNPWRLILPRAVGRSQTAEVLVRAFDADFANLPDPIRKPGKLGSAQIPAVETVDLPALAGYPTSLALPYTVTWESEISPVVRSGLFRRVTLSGSAITAVAQGKDLLVPARGGPLPAQIVRIEALTRSQTLEVAFELRRGRVERKTSQGTFTARVRLPLPFEKDFSKDKGYTLRVKRHRHSEAKLLPHRATNQPSSSLTAA